MPLPDSLTSSPGQYDPYAKLTQNFPSEPPQSQDTLPPLGEVGLYEPAPSQPAPSPEVKFQQGFNHAGRALENGRVEDPNARFDYQIGEALNTRNEPSDRAYHLGAAVRLADAAKKNPAEIERIRAQLGVIEDSDRTARGLNDAASRRFRLTPW